jgi:hypothetical protein
MKGSLSTESLSGSSERPAVEALSEAKLSRRWAEELEVLRRLTGRGALPFEVESEPDDVPWVGFLAVLTPCDLAQT